MYEDFFGLKDQPFKLCTDPAFLFLSASHARARAYLKFALLKPDGIVAITGDIGTGKSTLINSIQSTVADGTDVHVLHQTQLDDVQLLRAVLLTMGLARVPESKADLLNAAREVLLERHQYGRKTLLFVDDAHNLGAKALEELRMLADLEHNSEPLLGLVLVGQPALRRTLARSDLEQLRQRIRLHYRLEPLDRAATTRYIRHRLQIAGDAPARVFTSGCYPLIYRYTGGVPRRINLLCDMAMTAASLGAKRSVTPKCVDAAVRELGWRAHPLKWRARRALGWLHDGLFDDDLGSTSTIPSQDSQWPAATRTHPQVLLRRAAKKSRIQMSRWRRKATGAAVALALATGALATNSTSRRQFAPLLAALPLLLIPLIALAVTGWSDGQPVEIDNAAAQTIANAPASDTLVLALASTDTNHEPDATNTMGPPVELAGRAIVRVNPTIDRPVHRPIDRASDSASTASAGAQLKSAEWILGQQAQRYTIQILGTHRSQSLHRFARQHADDLTLAYFEQIRDERDWFVLVAGTYPSLAAARVARDAMPASIRNNGPWIRKFGEIQGLIGDASQMKQAASLSRADEVTVSY